MAAIGTKRFDDTLILFEDWDFLLNVLTSAELLYTPVRGPCVHKNDRTLGERRGARNDDRLMETLLEIYQKWPGRSPQTPLARQRYLQAAGVDPLVIEQALFSDQALKLSN
ncbi:hypothetical protein CCP4SC76_7540002 [Gammaproteobacteria bacterium]